MGPRWLSIWRPAVRRDSDALASTQGRQSQHQSKLEETVMAEYLILIYENESDYGDQSPEVWQQTMQAHGRFAEQIVELGAKMLGGNALSPTSTATSIRGDIVTDGPFTETKEALGGYYLIEAADLDQALAVAKLCPAPYGGVEVRPILDLPTG
jgi:hypothetical protein